MFWRPSPLVAAEPIRSAMRCLAMPSSGISTTLLAASAMPTHVSSGRAPPISARADSTATYGASRKNWIATSFWARVSATWENMREPVKRHTITSEAKPSMALSRPNPISAIEDATRPAAMATAPSTVIQARLSQDSSRARSASRS